MPFNRNIIFSIFHSTSRRFISSTSSHDCFITLRGGSAFQHRMMTPDHIPNRVWNNRTQHNYLSNIQRCMISPINRICNCRYFCSITDDSYKWRRVQKLFYDICSGTLSQCTNYAATWNQNFLPLLIFTKFSISCPTCFPTSLRSPISHVWARRVPTGIAEQY